MKVNSTVALPNGLVRFHIVEATGLGNILSSENSVDIAPLLKNRFLVVLDLGEIGRAHV